MLGLDDKLEEWRSAGVITDADAEAIRAYEQAASAGIAVWQEVLGYLGGTLALSAGAVLLGELWPSLTAPGQVTVFAVLAVALTAIGYVVPADREPAYRRLSSLLLAGGTAATGWAVGFTADELLGTSGDVTWLLASLAVLAHGLTTWRTRVAPLQQIGTFVGVWGSVGAVGALLELQPGAFVGGLLVVAVGLIWGLLTWGGLVRPATVGYLLAGISLGVGFEIAASDDLRVLALALALVAVLGVLAIGARLGDRVILGVGAAGVLLFVPQLIFELFADTIGAPLALLVAGVALTGGAVASIRMTRQVMADPAPSGADDTGAGESREAGESAE